MREAQVQGAKAEFAAELGAVLHMPADGVGPAEQRCRARHVAGGQRFAHRRARNTQAVHFVALHARHIEALRRTGSVEQRVVAGALRAEAEVVADQHVARAEPGHQHLLDELRRRLRGQALIEGQHHGLVDAAAFQFGEFVAQRRHARRCGLGLAGTPCKEVARVRLEGEYRRGHGAVPRFVDQQRQHRLMAAVHAVEVADRQGAGPQQGGMAQTAEDSHAADYPGVCA